MSDEFVIVSAADSGYFPLLRDLVLSIRDKPAGAPSGYWVDHFDVRVIGEARDHLRTARCHQLDDTIHTRSEADSGRGRPALRFGKAVVATT